jgi:hypothetical protein
MKVNESWQSNADGSCNSLQLESSFARRLIILSFIKVGLWCRIVYVVSTNFILYYIYLTTENHNEIWSDIFLLHSNFRESPKKPRYFVFLINASLYYWYPCRWFLHFHCCYMPPLLMHYIIFRLSGCPPFWHRRQAVLIRSIIECRYQFSSAEWADISDSAKDLVGTWVFIFCIKPAAYKIS